MFALQYQCPWSGVITLHLFSPQHQQQVATAVDRAKQVTMAELNQIIGVSQVRQSSSLPPWLIVIAALSFPLPAFLYHLYSPSLRCTPKLVFLTLVGMSPGYPVFPLTPPWLELLQQLPPLHQYQGSPPPAVHRPLVSWEVSITRFSYTFSYLPV